MKKKVVLLLIGYFVIWPEVRFHRNRGLLNECRENTKSIAASLDLYATDNNGQYPRNLNLLTPKYLKTLPKCPVAKECTYRADFGPNAPYGYPDFPNYYIIECGGSNHTLGSRAGYALHNSTDGPYKKWY